VISNGVDPSKLAMMTEAQSLINSGGKYTQAPGSHNESLSIVISDKPSDEEHSSLAQAH